VILADFSHFPSLADRAQQGFLNFMFLGRAMIHPDGFAAHEAFQGDDGEPLLDTSELFYEGNSQGGIMGGALTALAPDFTKSVLGVPGMNYSTLLNRNTGGWEDGYGDVFYASIPDSMDRQLGMALTQMLWDRAEGNGYAHHMAEPEYPNTPAKQVVLHVAHGNDNAQRVYERLGFVVRRVASFTAVQRQATSD
jgi:GNAT superfamily N-acetyltransferase